MADSSVSFALMTAVVALDDLIHFTWTRTGNIYTVTSTRNGNSIIIPMAGGYCNGNYDGERGMYWANNASGTNTSPYLNIPSTIEKIGTPSSYGSLFLNGASKFWAMSIRPVCD